MRAKISLLVLFAAQIGCSAQPTSVATSQSPSDAELSSADETIGGDLRVIGDSKAGFEPDASPTEPPTPSKQPAPQRKPIAEIALQPTKTRESAAVAWVPGAPLPSSVEELFAEARSTAEIMAARFPDLPDASELLARVYWISGKPLKAENVWKQVLVVHPKYPYALHGLGQVAAKKGDLKKAADYHWQAYEALPSYVDAAVEASTAWIKTGELQRSIELLESITSKYAKTALGWTRLGQAYTASREFPKAEEAFAKALTLNPSDVEALYGFALAAARNGKKDLASQAKEKHAALRAAGRQTTLEKRKTTDDLKNQKREIAAKYTSIGQIYFAREQYKVAESIWNRAAKLDPVNCDVREKLAGLHMGFQDAPAALAVCRELAGLKPENVQYQVNLAMMLDRTGKTEDAIDKFQQILKTTPSGQLHAMLADAYHRSGNLPAANKSIERAIEMEPDNIQWKSLRARFTAPQ